MTVASAFTPVDTELIPRVGSPGRAAVLTSLVAAAVEVKNLPAILTLARRGNPRSVIKHRGGFRWLAHAGLLTLYPEANADALCEALGCRPSRDRRQHQPSRRAQIEEVRTGWTPDQIRAVALAVATQEDHVLTARWIWPIATELTAQHYHVDVREVRGASGNRCVAHARGMAIYLTSIEGDINSTALASATEYDKKTVRYHISRTEDRRDEDGDLDAELTALGQQLRQRLDDDLRQWS